MIRTSGVVTLAVVVAGAIGIGVYVVERELERWSRPPDLVNCRGTIGVEVTGLSTALRGRFGVPAEVLGVIVSGVMPGGPADEAGLRVGDVVTAVAPAAPGATAPPVPNACAAEFRSGRDCQPFQLSVFRDGAGRQVTVSPVPEGEFMEDACDDGVQAACARLASLLLNGDGVPRDEARAHEMMRAACDGGNGDACRQFAQVTGYDPGRQPEALALYERACGLDDPTACLLYASAYAMGTLAPRDDEKATPIYVKSCDLGSALGCYNAGVMFNFARGVPEDLEKAARAYADGCAMGSTTACADEGYMRQHGRGVPQDEALAVTLYERACTPTSCQSANLLGCVNLGNVVRDGIGTPADAARAAGIFKSVCEGPLPSGDIEPERKRARACSLLGALYLVGNGVEANPAEGLALSTRGCDQADSYGCFNAGVVFSRGLGVEADEERAMEFFRRACAEGDEESCDYVLRKLPSAMGAEVRAAGR